jgi:hypothetical protein
LHRTRGLAQGRPRHPPLATFCVAAILPSSDPPAGTARASAASRPRTAVATPPPSRNRLPQLPCRPQGPRQKSQQLATCGIHAGGWTLRTRSCLPPSPASRRHGRTPGGDVDRQAADRAQWSTGRRRGQRPSGLGRPCGPPADKAASTTWPRLAAPGSLEH